MSSDNTKVLSIRVPSDIADQIDARAKESGVPRQKYIVDNFIAQEYKVTEKSIRQNDAFESSPPEEITQLLSATGGTLAGIGAYRFTQKIMSEIRDKNGIPVYNKNQTDFASFVAAIGVGFAGMKIIRDLE